MQGIIQYTDSAQPYKDSRPSQQVSGDLWDLQPTGPLAIVTPPRSEGNKVMFIWQYFSYTLPCMWQVY